MKSKPNIYDPMTYDGLMNRIRDGIPLTDHQKKTMEKVGLTVEDFKNEKSTEEKCSIMNYLRGVEAGKAAR